MSVHYKFKSALDFDTITFDGLHISVSDLKKAIMQQKRLGKTAEFDLQITNAQTKEEYAEESSLIPKNTSLTIARIPLANQTKKQWNPQEDANANAQRKPDVEQVHVDLSRMNGTEEDKIAAMIMQSTMDYDPTNYQRIRGSNQTGEVPTNYRCYKCQQPGHWIKNCPQGNAPPAEGQEPLRRTTGIPRSFITDEKKNELESKPAPTPVEKKPEVPDDLICSICKSLFTDAVMIPCCGSSFCDDCVRTALLESEDNECPDCHEKGSSPGSLIPNRFLRTSVNSFRNETGYNSRPRQQPLQPIAVPVPVVVVAAPTQPQPRTAHTPPPHEEHEARKSTPREDFHRASPVNEDSQQTMSMPGEGNQRGDDVSPRSSPPPPRKHHKQRYSDNDGEESENSHGDRDADDSDEEDNITVTVPPAHQQSRTAFRDRQANGRSWGVRPEYDRMAPRSNYNNAAYQMDQGRGSGSGGHPQQQQEGDKDEHQSHRRSSRDDSHHNSGHDQMRQQQHHGPGGDHHHQQQQQHHSLQEGGSREGDRYNRQMYNNNDQQQGPRSGYDNYHNNNAPMSSGNNNNSNNNNMHPYHGQQQRMGYEGNNSNQNMMGQQQHFNRGGPPGGFNNRFPNANNMNYGMRGGPNSGPGGMGGGPPIRGPNPMNQQLSSIYQGVAAKVGTGIIDDPLEAFNRIMREKELRKEEERGRRSPNDQRRSRERSVERARRRGSPPTRRSPEARMRAGERRRRSSSYSSSRSRSPSRSMRNRSRSPPIRKRSRSPPKPAIMGRRTRSRSPAFDQRSRGRDMRMNPNFHRNERNFSDHHNQHNAQQQDSYNRNRIGGVGGGRGWNNNGTNNSMNNRYPNEQHQQQPQQQFYNNSNYNGPHHSEGNYNMHQDQQQQHPRYPQNRYDREPGTIHHPQQQQQQYFNEPQYMDRRSPIDQPPVPGVDDNRPPVQQLQQPQQQPPNRSMPPMQHQRDHGGRAVPMMQDQPGGDRRQPILAPTRSVSPHESRSKEITGDRDRDRDRDRHRRRSRTPPTQASALGSRQHGRGGSQERQASSKDRRRSGGGGEGREPRAEKSRSEKKTAEGASTNPTASNPRGAKERDREKDRVDKRSSRHGEKEKERERTKDRDVREKEKRRESSESDSKKVKEKAKKKKKTTDKEKKKSKKEKKEKRSKDGSKNKSLTDGDKSGLIEKPDPEDSQKVEGAGDAEKVTADPFQVPAQPVPEPTTHSTPQHEEEEDILQLNETMESSKAFSPPGAVEHPLDNVLDIGGNIDYERELLEEEQKDQQQPKETAEVPELSKWERDDEDGDDDDEESRPRMERKEGGASLLDADTGAETPEEGEIDDDNKVTNEVLKRAENALFSRAINAIRPSEMARGHSLERKKMYVDTPPEKVLVVTKRTTPESMSPEMKQNVQITVTTATQRSSSRERCVEMFGEKRPRIGSVEGEHRKGQRSRSPRSQERSQAHVQGKSKLSVKERLGVKVTDERHGGRKRSASPVRRVKITPAASNERGGGRGGQQERDRDRERTDRERERGELEKSRRRSSPVGHGSRIKSPAPPQPPPQPPPQLAQQQKPHQSSSNSKGRHDDRNRMQGVAASDRRREETRDRDRERDRDRDRERERVNQRGNTTTTANLNRGGGGGSSDRSRGADGHRMDRNREVNNVSRDRGGQEGLGQERTSRQSPNRGERKRSRTVSPVRDAAKKSRRDDRDRGQRKPDEGEKAKDRERDRDRERERKSKQPIDESNFEPDYEHMDPPEERKGSGAGMIGAVEKEKERDGRKAILTPPPPLKTKDDGEQQPPKDQVATKKRKSRSPGRSGGSSSDSSSDSSSSGAEGEDGEEGSKKRSRKKSKHSKKSKKSRRGTSSDSEERSRKNKKSKKSKKKKKHKHK